MRSNNEDRLLITIRLSRKKPPFVRWSSGVFEAYGSIALLVSLGLDLTMPLAKKSPPVANKSQSVASFRRHLTSEQLQALSRCARGISLRFDALEIVNALVAGGYAQKGVAGVITVTDEGREYLRNHAS